MAVFDNYEKLNDGKILYQKDDFSDIALEKCKDGNFTFKLNKNDKNIYIHSKYNPVKEAQKFVDEIEERKGDDVYVIFGFGLGHFLRELMKDGSKRNFYVVYEPNYKLFSKVVEEGYCNDLFENERLYLISGEGENEVGLFLNQIISPHIQNRVRTLIMPTYQNVYFDEIKKFFEIVKNSLSDSIVSRNTVWNFEEKWTRQTFDNIDNLLNSYSTAQFHDVFKGKTAIVVAAGPSLQKNMHLLKEVKGKVPIISVFVAAKVLLANGIKPDFIVAVDANQKGMEEGKYDDIPLIYDSRLPKEFIESHKGKNIFSELTSDSFVSELIEKYNKASYPFNGGGSVACACTCIAKLFGCKNIILIGQDLAYTNDLCHVEGTDHNDKTSKDVDREKIEIPAIGGGTVLTDSVFLYYINWFEQYAALNKHEANIIDATEGGALLKNMEIITLREAIDKYAVDAKVDETIASVFEKGVLFTEEERKIVIDEIEKEFLVFDDTLDLIEKEKEAFEKYIKSLEHKSNINGIIKIERKLDDYDEELSKLAKKSSLLIALAKNIIWANSYFDAGERFFYDDDVLHSAHIRKKRLLELEAGIKSIKALKEEKENER